MMGYILFCVLIIFYLTNIIANENPVYLSHCYMSHKLVLLFHFEHSELRKYIIITLGYIVPHD